jgi:hypothetical protein
MIFNSITCVNTLLLDSVSQHSISSYAFCFTLGMASNVAAYWFGISALLSCIAVVIILEVIS